MLKRFLDWLDRLCFGSASIIEIDEEKRYSRILCPTCGRKFDWPREERGVSFMSGKSFWGVCAECSNRVVETKGRCFPDKIWVGKGLKHYCKNGIALSERDACIMTMGFYYLDDHIRKNYGDPAKLTKLPEGSEP